MPELKPEHQHLVPHPDPTLLTTEQMLRETAHLRELFETQLEALAAEFRIYKLEHVERHQTVVNDRIERLREDIAAGAIELDRRYQQRYDAQKEAIDAAFKAAQEAVSAAFKAQQDAIAAALAAVDKSVSKTELANQKKFEDLANAVAIASQLSGRIERLSERIEGVSKVTDAKFVTYRTLLDSEAEKVKLALSANDKALAKAEAANEQRFAGVNEFRGQLSDQARTLMPRQESEQRSVSLSAKFDALYASHEATLSDIKSRLDRAEGNSGGLKAGWGYLVGLIGVFATVIGVTIALIASFHG